MREKEITEVTPNPKAILNPNVFDDCPDCLGSGKIAKDNFDDPDCPSLLIPCPTCAKRRQDLIKHGKTIESENGDKDRQKLYSDLLRIPSTYQRYRDFSLDGIYEDYLLKNMVHPNSYKMWCDEVEQVYATIVSGKIPSESLIIGFPHGDPTSFIVNCILGAYANGRSVTPFISEIDVRDILNEVADTEEEEVSSAAKEHIMDEYDVIDTDICIIYLTMGASKKDVYNVGSIMQRRAMKAKPTIICTTNVGSIIKNLTDVDRNAEEYHRLSSKETTKPKSFYASRNFAMGRYIELCFKSDITPDIFKKYLYGNKTEEYMHAQAFAKNLHNSGKQKEIARIKAKKDAIKDVDALETVVELRNYVKDKVEQDQKIIEQNEQIISLLQALTQK